MGTTAKTEEPHSASPQPMSPGDRVVVTRFIGCCERTARPYHGKIVKLVRRIKKAWCTRYMMSRSFDCWDVEDHNGERTCFSEASLRPTPSADGTCEKVAAPKGGKKKDD